MPAEYTACKMSQKLKQVYVMLSVDS